MIKILLRNFLAKYFKRSLKYWPVSKELMTQYNDGSHTEKNSFGSLYWQNQNSLLHRDGDKPARIYANGRLDWLQNGKRHRDGDLPAYINVEGTLVWYQNYLIHRDGDLPAVFDADGSLWWYQNGNRHRIYGPAVIYPDGRQEWWINDENITEEVKEWLNGEEWQGTPEQIFEFQLRFV